MERYSYNVRLLGSCIWCIDWCGGATSRTLNDPNPEFKGMSLSDAKYIRNGKEMRGIVTTEY